LNVSAPTIAPICRESGVGPFIVSDSALAAWRADRLGICSEGEFDAAERVCGAWRLHDVDQASEPRRTSSPMRWKICGSLA
jgi:hypothetical protein